MENKKILFICGSLNQTKMMHAVSKHFRNYELFFTPYYADGITGLAADKGFLDFTPLGGRHKEMTLEYLREHGLTIAASSMNNDYDLIYTCSDLLVQKNLRKKKVILIQEGMTDPENIFFYLAKYLNLPRWLASTSTTGLSDIYNYFCVASEGYKKHFIKKGIKPSKIKVTGIPNFDNIKENLNNDFPHKNFVLVATSDARETFKYENRKKFILEAVKKAEGKQLIFKLHPNENFERGIKEINKYAPGALVYTSGNIDHMIANCDVLITKYSTVVYIGLALCKKVYSYFNIDELKELLPIQNDATSGYNIAQVGYQLINEEKSIEFVSAYNAGYNEV